NERYGIFQASRESIMAACVVSDRTFSASKTRLDFSALEMSSGTVRPGSWTFKTRRHENGSVWSIFSSTRGWMKTGDCVWEYDRTQKVNSTSKENFQFIVRPFEGRHCEYNRLSVLLSIF